MRILFALAAAVAIAALAAPASADGTRRVWRSSHYAGVGAISRNVITPYYVGYYGSHYSYYKPDPVPPPVYWDYPVDPACWAWSYYGRRYWVC